MGHIVVGVDETPQASAALRWAAEESARRGCRLTAVLAWDLLSQHHRDLAPFDPHYGEADARETLESIVRRTLGGQRAEGVERRVVCDLPAHALLDAARDADLLVVGSRDLHGIRGALAGSVSASCRRRSPCPMLIVHSDGRTEAVDVPAPAKPTTASGSDTSGPATARDVTVEWQILDDDRRPPVHHGGR